MGLLREAAAALLVSLVMARYWSMLDLGKMLSPASANCTLLAPDVLPVEDLVEFKAGVAIGGAGSVRRRARSLLRVAHVANQQQPLLLRCFAVWGSACHAALIVAAVA